MSVETTQWRLETVDEAQQNKRSLSASTQRAAFLLEEPECSPSPLYTLAMILIHHGVMLSHKQSHAILPHT